MKRRLLIVALAGSIFVSAGGVIIKLQDRRQNPPPPAPNADEQRKIREAEQARALSLLDEVAREASTWNDPATVRVLTDISKLTWQEKPEYARKSLQRAFDIVIQMLDEGRYRTGNEESLFQRVLTVAGQKDPQLAQDLAAKFQEAVLRRDVKATSAKPGSKPSNDSSSEAGKELMAYAASVADQQPDLAAQLARRSLNFGISADLANVVGRLRHTHPDLAAQVLTTAVNTLAQSSRATVLDAFYIQGWIGNEAIGKHLSAEVLRQYFNAASRIIERDLKTPVTPADTYFMATQLLPLYDQFAPERSAFIRTRILELRNHPEVQKQEEKERQLETRPRGQGAVEERLARARSAASEAERDARLIGLASDLRRLGQLDRALQVLGEISDSEKRTNFQDYFLVVRVNDFVKSGKLEESLAWAHRIPTPARRARALAQVAQRQAESGKREVALVTLDEARQILLVAPKTVERALSQLFVAMISAKVDSHRGFEILTESAIAANETPGINTLELTGERVVIEDEGFTSHFVLPPPLKVDLTEGFKSLAKADFERAMASAQSFKAREIRAQAMIAVAAALLQTPLRSGGHPPRPGPETIGEFLK
jgi:hypothetical protein